MATACGAWSTVPGWVRCRTTREDHARTRETLLSARQHVCVTTVAGSLHTPDCASCSAATHPARDCRRAGQRQSPCDRPAPDRWRRAGWRLASHERPATRGADSTAGFDPVRQLGTSFRVVVPHVGSSTKARRVPERTCGLSYWTTFPLKPLVPAALALSAVRRTSRSGSIHSRPRAGSAGWRLLQVDHQVLARVACGCLWNRFLMIRFPGVGID